MYQACVRMSFAPVDTTLVHQIIEVLIHRESFRHVVNHAQPSSRDTCDVAIICALRIESDAAEAIFDQF